jgi:hypothetical protein
MIVNKQLLHLYEEEDRGYLSHIVVDRQPLVITYPEQKHFVKSKLQTYEQAQIKITHTKIDPCFKNFDTACNGKIVRNKMVVSVLNPQLVKNSEVNSVRKIYMVVQ